jgi:hypothetical protein
MGRKCSGYTDILIDRTEWWKVWWNRNEKVVVIGMEVRLGCGGLST